MSQSCRTLKLKHWVSLDNMAPLCNVLLSLYLRTCTSLVRNGIVPYVAVLHWLWFQSLVPIFNFRLVVLDKRWSLNGSMLESLKQMCWEVFPSPCAPLILFTWSPSTDAYCKLLSHICWKEWFLERLWVTFRALVWTLGRGNFSFNFSSLFLFSVPCDGLFHM